MKNKSAKKERKDYVHKINVLCLVGYLETQYPVRYEIYKIRCGTCHVVFDLVGSVVAVTDKRISLL